MNKRSENEMAKRYKITHMHLFPFQPPPCYLNQSLIVPAHETRIFLFSEDPPPHRRRYGVSERLPGGWGGEDASVEWKGWIAWL